MRRYALADALADAPSGSRYVNNTGLMWQLGQEMQALLVFAEHRYYGKNLPSCVLDERQSRARRWNASHMDFMCL